MVFQDYLKEIEERKEQGPSFLQGDCNTEYLNYDEVTFPLIIRTWEPGDWFHPLGLAGTQKLKKYFSDNKVPVRERHTVPLLLFGDRIAWVCGLRIDERFKVKPDSKRVLKAWVE